MVQVVLKGVGEVFIQLKDWSKVWIPFGFTQHPHKTGEEKIEEGKSRTGKARWKKGHELQYGLNISSCLGSMWLRCKLKIWIQLLGPLQDMGTKSSNTHNIWLV